ncbi:MAG: hypothetical protein IT510_05350 [Sulfuritalea sp.]|nr:hypothetical protein [Sulfuritalea sp.]
MTTAKDVADWLCQEFQNTTWLYQETVVYKIKSQFGVQFVYFNAQGNYGVSKEVLKHFRKLTEGKAIWDRGQRAWRHLRNGEKYKGRQVD